MAMLPPGSLLSHYRVKALIARGGMGEVYEAVDLRLERAVAIKLLSPRLAADPSSRQRFLREARAASHFSHSNICTIFEVVEEAGVLFIVMQYLKGRTIKATLEERRPLPLEKALHYAIDVTAALEEAHRNGIVHRDIKPSNIIVNEHDQAVVLDFGLAKRVQYTGPLAEENPTLSQLTAEAAILGTTAYMSPEQVRGETVDARSDIFSLGILLFEMVTGQRPFGGKNEVEVMHAILHDDPPPLSTLRDDADADLSKIIQKALQKKSGERFSSALEMRDGLLEFCEKKGYLSTELRSKSKRTFTLLSGRDGGGTLSLLSQVHPLVYVTAFLILLLGAWFAFRGRLHTDQIAPVNLHDVGLVNWISEPGELEPGGTFSPDGKMIAFSSSLSGSAEIFVKQIQGGDPFQVTQGPGKNTSPLWSPDSQQIAFVSDRSTQTGIWVIPALGGPATLLKTMKSVRPALDYWSKDGKRIYFEWRSNLFVLDLKTKEVLPKTSFDQSKRPPQWFSVSPAEDRIAYYDRRGGRLNLWVVPMGGGEPVQITHDPEEALNPAWHPDGKRIVYSSLRNGTHQIGVAYLDGRPSQQISFGESSRFVSDISPDGGRILYTMSREESDIWSVRVDNQKESQVTSDIDLELWPDIAPDNATIAFQSIPGSSVGVRMLKSFIFARPVLAKGSQVQLTSNGFEVRWSPTGNQLAFLRNSEGGLNLWRVDATGSEEKQLSTVGVSFAGYRNLPYNRFQTEDYSWSPNGKEVAFCSSKTGAGNVWTVSAEGLNEKPVSRNSNKDVRISGPLWSPDGQRIAYLSWSSKRVAEGNVWSLWTTDREEAKPVYEATSAQQLIGWSNSGRGVLLGATESKKSFVPAPTDVRLIQVSVADGTRQVLTPLNSAYWDNIRLSPDRKWVAFASRADGADNLWIVPVDGGSARKVTRNPDPKIYFSTLAWSPDGKTIYYGKQASRNLISMIDNFK